MFDLTPLALLAAASDASIYLLLSVCVACAAVFGTLLFIAGATSGAPATACW